MARRRLPPFEIEIERLAPRGLGEGVASDGHPMRVRNAVPGSRVHVVPAGRRKGVWTGRKVHTVRPAAAAAAPACAVFERCGGCQLQELSVDAQREHKQAMALAMVRDKMGDAWPEDVVVHPVQGTPSAYGYRNRVEFSFGVRRWLTEADQAAGLPHAGRFIGMHPPGRFDRVVDTERCEIASEGTQRILAHVRRVALHDEAPLPRDVRTHEGFWRHVRIRESVAHDERLVTVFTSSPRADEAEWVERLAEACLTDAVGLVWCVDDGVADVARGEVRAVWGRDHLVEVLTTRDAPEGRAFRLSPTSFFQTNTRGAELLYDCIGEAVGRGGTLLDLYCGTGSIGITLAARVDRVVGVEEVEAAVEDARRNAEANGVVATYTCARVEDVVHELDLDTRIVVDPPRAGLHPKVARALAQARAEALVYVACHPGSLGRDAAVLAEGGWRLVELWTVDLFPQTGHVEMVGRFER